jgi:predicted phosphodiesterase
MEDLISGTPMAEVDEMLGPRRARVLAGGHTHLQMLRQHRGALIVNPGSAGMPFREYAPGGPPVVLAHAELATVELDERSGAVDVTFHRVPLDRAELRAAADDSALPLRGMLAAQYA